MNYIFLLKDFHFFSIVFSGGSGEQKQNLISVKMELLLKQLWWLWWYNVILEQKYTTHAV